MLLIDVPYAYAYMSNFPINFIFTNLNNEIYRIITMLMLKLVSYNCIYIFNITRLNRTMDNILPCGNY